ncbi:Bcr/CflA family efflux MFS transporter [Hahella sp. KA22]|uniref:multidrug effflux MFS transporter n=1 Tax=Hahella sp. KA22 TaxID=1628392 RepID=UPI000FDEB47F|nr:multidrug effflux MFS transporter [Hahella sp. KA22]AZZ91903.1 Bcr/CflA family efflux MFS transporter [Hahella sp. KA22]QAY55274.1 Bcr/CflA family efflux MFS transporter [Hahella sp. KA22]
MTSSSSHSRLAFILAMAVALGPFAIDTYLPAFPDIAKAIGADIHDVSLSISVYILGLAIGQLIGGPLSDRLGRSRIMLTGLGVFLFSCLMLSQSESLASLLIWRFTQAFGGGWCAVSVPAIIRDRTEGQETAKLFSLIGLIMIAAPAIAPTLGSTILAFADWRWIFLFLALYTGVVIVTLWFSLFADAPPHSPPPKRNVLADYLEILKNTAALRFIFIQSLGFSVMLTFLTHASFIYQEWFNLSEFAFSLLFAGNIAVMALMSMANRALLTWVESAQLLRLAVWLQTFGVALLVAIVFLYPSLYLFAPALMLSVGSLGAAMPNGSACFIQFFKSNSGTASALMGALQFTISGAISALSSALSDGTLIPIVAVMFMCALLNAAFAWGAPGAARKAFADA